MPEFKIVDKSRRANRYGAIVNALIQGNTVAIPYGKQVSGQKATLKRLGFRVRQHRDGDEIVVWAEKIEDVP